MAVPREPIDWRKLFAELSDERRRELERPGGFQRLYMQEVPAPPLRVLVESRNCWAVKPELRMVSSVMNNPDEW